MYYNIRNVIDKITVTGLDIREEITYGDDEEFILKNEALSIIDDIEAEFREFEELIQPIEGLSEINEIKRKIKEMLKALY